MANKAARACRVAAVIFGLIFVLHVWRLLTQTEVVFGTRPVPMAASWLALVVSGGLAWWMWRSSFD